MTNPVRMDDTASALDGWGDAEHPIHAVPGTSVRRVAPFIGREQVLQHIFELAESARSGHGVVIALGGEAGIGKTRLLREAARRALGFGLQVVLIDETPRIDEVVAGIAGGQLGLVDVPTAAPRPPLELFRTSRRPALVVFDDALSTERLPDLAALARAGVAHLPVLVMLGLSPELARSAADARRILAALARQRVLTEITLPPLGEAELFALGSHLLDRRPDSHLQETISALSEGNPFLAEAIIADLRNRGLVHRLGDFTSLVRDLPPDYTPPTVERMLAHTFALMDADVLQTLAAAAALGPGFQFEVLRRATGQLDDRLLDHLEAGVAAGIVREATEPPDDFQFTHELVRRALHGGLSRVRRHRLHRMVADGVPASPDGRDRPSGDDDARATSVPGEPEALARTMRALERAERLCSWDEAVRLCRTALDLTRRGAIPDTPSEILLLDRLAALYFGRVQTFAAGACLREAVQLCTEVDRPLLQVVLTARLAALGPSWCSIEAAEALFKGLGQRSAGPPTADTGALFDVHVELGLAHQRYGRLPRAVSYVRTASALVDPSDWARHTLGLFVLGALLVSTGQLAEAIGLLRSALFALDAGMAEQWSHDDQVIHWRDPRRTRCLVLAELARALDLTGKTDEAERLAEAAREEEIRFGILGGRAHRAIAQVELRRGRAPSALQVLATTSDEALPGSLNMRRAADLVLVSSAHLSDGNLELALETALEGVSICLRTGAGESLAGLHVAAAKAHLALGRHVEAREAIVAAHRAVDDVGTEVYRADAHAVADEIDAAMGLSTAHRLAATGGDQHDTAAPTAVGTAIPDAAPRPPEAGGMDVQGAYVRGRSLTQREREILELLAAGGSNRQIAARLGLSDKTIKRHVSNIFNKLAANTRAAAVRRGLESGIL